MLETAQPGPLARMLGHTTVVLLLLTAGYYVLPLRFPVDESGSWVRLAVSLVLLALLAMVFRAQVRRSRRSQTTGYLRVQWLLTALYVLVLSFALAYAAVATISPDQFVGITDRTDALYFSVTLVATVGFGDIHPTGTFGQLLATAHMLFNLIYLGTALRMLTAGAPAQRSADGAPTGTGL
jgi:voltage-gated potassium channel